MELDRHTYTRLGKVNGGAWARAVEEQDRIDDAHGVRGEVNYDPSAYNRALEAERSRRRGPPKSRLTHEAETLPMVVGEQADSLAAIAEAFNRGAITEEQAQAMVERFCPMPEPELTMSPKWAK